MTRVLINADDYGLSDGICRGILELVESGHCSNTTVMMTAGGAVERIARWGTASLRGLAGVHLQLTGGVPLAGAGEAPTLVTSSGRYVPRKRLGGVRTEDVLIEWDRQITLFAEVFGVSPTHLDSHHGVHHLPNCAPAFFELAARYGLPVRGGSNELATDVAGIRGSDVVLYDWTASGAGGIGLAGRIARAARGTPAADPVIEVVTHPGYDDPYLRAVSSLNAERELDLRGLNEFGSLLDDADHALRLTCYPEFA